MSENMRRRDFLKAIGAAGCALGLPVRAQAGASAKTAPSRPNILFIMTDQQRWDMMSCAGNRWLKTPAMDSLAATGARFDRAYCANPVCVPSRFAMMTGVMPSRIGMEENSAISNKVSPAILQHALGRVFHDAGYETAYGGKVHLPATMNSAEPYGFDYLTANERQELATTCSAFLRRKHERPFLLFASFINPHDICYMAISAYQKKDKGVAPKQAALAEAMRIPAGVSRSEFFNRLCPPLPDNFEVPQGEPPGVRQSDWRPFRAYVQAHWTAEQWRLHRWAYARLTERVDAEIGTVLQALRDAGLEDRTVVVFTSDHGDMDASHRMEHKSMPYEEAIHVPLIVSWKGVTPGGAVDRTHLVSTGLDLIPTLCDFAGISSPLELKGRSVKPLAVSDAARAQWRDVLVVENEGCRVVRSERYKYAVYGAGEPREFLLDEQADPGEMRNLAGDPAHRQVLEQHRALLKRWYQEHGESLDAKYVVSSEATKAP